MGNAAGLMANVCEDEILKSFQKTIDDEIVKNSPFTWDEEGVELDFDSKLTNIVNSMMIKGYRPISAKEYIAARESRDKVYVWIKIGEDEDSDGGEHGFMTIDDGESSPSTTACTAAWPTQVSRLYSRSEVSTMSDSCDVDTRSSPIDC
jgi:hypothetical protein